MRIPLFFVFLLPMLECAAQVVQVIDPLDYRPIADVVISDTKYTKSVKTNLVGQVSLAPFSAKDSLVFENPYYNTKKVSYKTLKKDGFKMFLLDKSFMFEIEVDDGLKRDPPKTSTNSQIKILAPDEIANINAQTTADMLESTGSVMVQKSQAGGGSPIIRGFEANRILLVVDGVRMNNAIYRSGHLQNAITVDNNVLQSTDIYFGPGSVIYGSDALGGVIHFHTKTPRFKGAQDFTGASVKSIARYSSINQERTGHIDLELGGKKWAYLASLTRSSFGDLRMGLNRVHGFDDFGLVRQYAQRINGKDSAVINADPSVQVGTAYGQYDVLQKVRYKASQNFDLIWNTQYSTSTNIGRFDRLNDTLNGTPKYAEWYYGPQRRLLTSLKGVLSNQSGFFNKASFIVAFQDIDEDRINRKFNNDWRNSRFEDVQVYSLNLDFAKTLNERQSISYGAEATHNIVTSTAYSQNIQTLEKVSTSTRYPDGGSTMSTFATYFAYDRKLSKYAILKSGVRYSRAVLKSSFLDSSLLKLPFDEINFNGGALSGSLGIMVEPDPTSKVNFILSTGFRSPNVDDYGKVFEKNGYVVVPNNELKPENAYNGEISFVKSFRKTIKTVTSSEQKAEAIRLGAGVFYTQLTNTIVRVNHQLNGEDSILYDGELARVQTNSNASNAFLLGGSAECMIRFTPSINWNTTVTYSFGEDLSNSAPLGHIPPIYGQSTINLARRRWNMSVFARFNGAKQAIDYSPNGEDNLAEATKNGTPAWYTINLKLGIHLHEYALLQLGCYNLFDQHYKQFASGISAPGRNLSFTLRMGLNKRN